MHTMCESGATVEELQEQIKKSITKELKTVKKDTGKAIKNADK